MRRPSFGSQAGQAVVLVALSMSGLLLGAGLAIDTGQLFVVRRDAQAAADAGAWAGAVALRNGDTSSQAEGAATADATANGFTTDATTTVTVSNPPSSGPHAGDDQYVEVVITVQVETALMPRDFTTVRARAVAGVAPIAQDYAIVSLEPSADNALTTSSNGSLTVSGGGIMINSSSSTAASLGPLNNPGTVTIAEPFGTDVVGDAVGNWPNEQTGQDPLPDPYLNFPMPDPDELDLEDRTPECCELLPGVYTDSVTGTGVWTMQPGIYIFKDAQIDLSGQGGLSGTGVFIFFTTSTYPVAGGSCPDPTFELTGQADSDLSALTSGTYKGMLIYQDPACDGTIRVGGNGAITGVGTIYAPSAHVQGNGQNSAIALSQVVSKTMDAQNGDFVFNYSNDSVAAPRIPALSE